LFSAGAKVVPQVLGCRVWEKLRRGCRRVGWRDAALRVFGQRHCRCCQCFCAFLWQVSTTVPLSCPVSPGTN